MAAQLLAIKQFDTAPAIRIGLTHDDGAAMDLTNVDRVRFSLRDAYTLELVSIGTCTIDVPEDGLVSYSWQPADTAQAGEFVCAFTIESAAGRQTFPASSSLHLQVIPNSPP